MIEKISARPKQSKMLSRTDGTRCGRSSNTSSNSPTRKDCIPRTSADCHLITSSFFKECQENKSIFQWKTCSLMFWAIMPHTLGTSQTVWAKKMRKFVKSRPAHRPNHWESRQNCLFFFISSCGAVYSTTALQVKWLLQFLWRVILFQIAKRESNLQKHIPHGFDTAMSDSTCFFKQRTWEFFGIGFAGQQRELSCPPVCSFKWLLGSQRLDPFHWRTGESSWRVTWNQRTIFESGIFWWRNIGKNKTQNLPQSVPQSNLFWWGQCRPD